MKSTLAAEAAALSEAQDQLEYSRVLFMQMLGQVDGRNWQEALKMPGYLVMDAKSLYDSLKDLRQKRNELLSIWLRSRKPWHVRRTLRGGHRPDTFLLMC